MFDDFLEKAVYKDPAVLVRVAASAVLLYAVMLVLNRLHGTRTTSKMNNFDWIVSVATGTIFGSAVVNDSVTLAQSCTAFVCLMGLQWVVTYCSSRSGRFYHFVTASPALLFHRGAFLDDRLHSERVTREEVLSAVRAAGVSDLSEVSAVVLEPDGGLSVLPGRGTPSPDLLRPVKYAEPAPRGGNAADLRVDLSRPEHPASQPSAGDTR